MALHWRPVGPLPASVYWRRRAVLLGGLVVLLLLLRSCGGDDPQRLTTDGATPTGSASAPGRQAATGSPQTPTAAPPAPTACPDAAVRVEARPEKAQYATGDAPRFVLTVRNTGATPCTRAIGQGAVELVVTSGADRIWSSDDCAPDGPMGPVLLKPGEERRRVVAWSGRRSKPGCDVASDPVPVGTYVVTGRAGTARGAGSVFRFR